MELHNPLLIGDLTWADAEPGTISAVLVMRDVCNPSHHDGINDLADDLESELRTRFVGDDRAAIQATPPIPAYAAFYKRFGQRYHVGLQVESVQVRADAGRFDARRRGQRQADRAPGDHRRPCRCDGWK